MSYRIMQLELSIINYNRIAIAPSALKAALILQQGNEAESGEEDGELQLLNI